MNQICINILLSSPAITLSVSGDIDRFLGFSKKELIDNHINLIDRVHSHDKDISEMLCSADLNNVFGQFNFRLRHANDHIICVKGHFNKKLDDVSGYFILKLELYDAKELWRNSDLSEQSMTTHFKAMMKNTQDYIYFKDNNHVFTGASETLLTITNSSGHCNDLIGLTDYDLFPEGYADIYYSLEKQVLSGIDSAHEEQEILKNNGNKALVDNHSYPIKNDDGEIIGLFGIARDITKRKKSESKEKSRSYILELIASETRLSDILEAIILSVEQENNKMLGSILLLDDTEQHLLTGAAPSLPGFYNEAINGIKIGNGVGSCGTSAFTGKAVFVDDIHNHPYWSPYKELVEQANLGSCWSTPIFSTHGKVLGTFAIYHHEVSHPSDSDIELIEWVTHLTSIAIEHKKFENKLRLAASVFTYAREAILITDADSNIIEVNDTFTHITGYNREEVIGKTPGLLKSGRQSPKFYSDMRASLREKQYWHGEIWNRRKNGEVYPEMLTISSVLDNSAKVKNYVALFSDITQLKKQQQQLEHIAHYDMLTNLPNRVLLAAFLSQTMLQCHRHNKLLAVVYIDLDGFKAVNDRYGHDTGDKLLIMISHRMKEALRGGDTLARIGGDEFVAVLSNLNTIAECEPVLERLLRAASENVNIDDVMVKLSASLGVTIYPQDAIETKQLIHYADQAMYQAKQTGKNQYHLYDSAHDYAVKTD